MITNIPPYNKNNFLISSLDVINILKEQNINNFNIKDLYLFQKSFIHESYTNLKCYSEFKNENNNLKLQDESYERLEFLGDSLIGCIIADYLYKRYHEIYNVDEGFLTKIRTRIIMGKTLTYLSNCINFNKYIIISDHIEKKYKGRENMQEHKILCDVFEAFCGALYLNSNFETLYTFLICIIEKYINFSDLIITDINYKDKLSRYVKKNYNYNIKYDTVLENDIYKCNILNDKNKIISTIKNTDKKQSEQLAAKEALKYFNILY